jgi:hypothetical protein
MCQRLFHFLALAAFVVMILPAQGWSKPKDSVSTTISVSTTVSVNNKTLEPGEYKVVVEGNTAKFERDGDVVTEAPCTWKTLPNKSQYSDVATDHNRITEIDFSGKTQAIVFPSN